MISVEKATLADCWNIAVIHNQCWLEAYDFIPDKVHKHRSVEYRLAQWRQSLIEPKFGDALFVLKSSGRVVGFAFAKANEDFSFPSQGELHAAYVLKGSRGGVSGPMLMSAMVNSLVQDGLEPIGLWAFKENRMKHTYKALGWVPVVSREREIAGLRIPEIGFIHPDIEKLLGVLDRVISRKKNSVARRVSSA